MFIQDNSTRKNADPFFSSLDLFISEIEQLKEVCIEHESKLEFSNLKNVDEDYKNQIQLSNKLQEELEERELEIKKLNKKIIILEEDVNKIKALSILPEIEEKLQNFTKDYSELMNIKIE